ncbi:hypothetical protein HMPREF7215_2515 [Pyramidobacter piscolens W5455]|uniref:Uncharacterized protein n=1 Tax=Pyramidobacter piscolens W5455 TaxID=352165 RepID=A0ABM9ZSV5_9BACT|nr:hypothetical protein HMPREF7215_2515 [Pyramidobacter piscolens W5455]BDF78144.1 hypothetical protein CE91St28_09380 [Pyramidobacter piscolens]
MVFNLRRATAGAAAGSLKKAPCNGKITPVPGRKYRMLSGLAAGLIMRGGGRGEP